MDSITKLTSTFVALFIALACALPAAAANNCESNFNDVAALRTQLGESISKWQSSANVGIQSQLTAVRQNALTKYDQLPADVRQIFSESAVLQVLLDAELPVFHQRLEQLFTKLQAGLGEFNDLAGVKNLIRTELQSALKNRAPAASVEQRIQGVETNFSTKESLLNALGFLTLEQTKQLLYGGDLNNPSPDSLVGQFIERTGAKSVVRGFAKGPNEPNGENRLVVATSTSTFQIYKELFVDPHFLVHTHSPSQGTLYVGFNGKVYSWSNGSNQDLREMNVGSLLPHIVFSSSEANRATNYFGLMQDSAAQHPWTLTGQNGAYCAKGGYTSCTHWVANIPVGDTLVDSYTLPGNVDQYAGNASGPGAQTQVLNPHTHASALMQQVWKAPGNEQLASVLGVQDGNVRGELANPGWVLHVLTAQASAARVPLVFVWTEDHKQDLDPNFPMNNNPY